MELAHVQQLVNEKFPGVELESAVQGWFYLADYDRGIEAYRAIKNPTPQDDRWAGTCHSMRQEHMEAQAVLYRALTRGEEAAHVQLARALNFLGRSVDALAELDKTDLAKLSTPDKAMWYRARSIQIEYQSNLKQAVELAEEAWRLVQGLAEYPIYAHWILLRLGRLHGQTGRAQRALWFIERATELFSEDYAAPNYLRLSKVEALISLGRYADAIQELNGLNGKASSADGLLLEATAAWGMNDIRRAIELYDQVVERTSSTEQGQPELLARLALVALRGSRGAFETAAVHLMRADFLRSSTQDHLYFRFRDVQLKYWTRHYNAKQAANELNALSLEFGEMGLLQEQGWVRLHLAEMYRVQGDDRWFEELDTLKGLAVVLQNKAFLNREWVLLPELREAALLTHPEIAGKARVVFEVYTMGTERLVLGGQVVNIRLRRGCEVLAYFLEHGQASLKQVLVDVFADEEPKTARIYFHQFRHELAERVPGLSVDYDGESKLYRLCSEVDILWDVAEMRAGRKMGDHGIFLPSSGSEWAQLLDQALEPVRNQPSPDLHSKS